jgi:hypothetical protein
MLVIVIISLLLVYANGYINCFNHRSISSLSRLYITSSNSNDIIHSEVKGIPIAVPSSLVNSLANGNHRIIINNNGYYDITINDNHISISSNDDSNIGIDASAMNNPVVAMIEYSSVKLDKKIVISSPLTYSSSSSSSEEYVDWLSDDEQVLASLPRVQVHQLNLLHKGIGVLIVNSNSDIFVHQRSSTKRLFPSMFDMFIGGVCSSNEAPGETLVRELYEEAGLDFSSPSSSPLSSSPLISNNFSKKSSSSPPLWISSEADKAWQNFKKSSSYSLLFTALPDTNDDSSSSIITTCSSCLKYLKKCRIKTSLNYCVVYVYIAICSKAMEGIINTACIIIVIIIIIIIFNRYHSISRW